MMPVAVTILCYVDGLKSVIGSGSKERKIYSFLHTYIQMIHIIGSFN